MNIFENALEFVRQGREFSVLSKYSPTGIIKGISGRKEAVRGGFSSFGDEGAELSEYYALKPRLIVFGGGHIALPLTSIGAMCGFEVAVYDDRPAFANAKRFPYAAKTLCDSFDNVANHIALSDRDYVVIVTRGHRNDQDCLRYVLAQGVEPFYCGMIGSKRRVAIVLNQLRDEGYPADRIEKINSPIGLDIGAVTPEEIAVAIVGQLIEYRRRDDRRGHYHGNFQFAPEEIERLAESDGAALLTVVRTDGSTPREEGARMIIFSDGSTFGTIGGGCSEADAARQARQVLDTERGWGVYAVDMTDDADEDGMVCGGSMKVLIERI
ncbi:MAG: XdhC family protein [Oscillospiraceae bacterium]|jgi:xanthine dehydrogenase accessory factor|nr:XdhC family protein [Oscillospiraceae bacterium]